MGGDASKTYADLGKCSQSSQFQVKTAAFHWLDEAVRKESQMKSVEARWQGIKIGNEKNV